MPDTWGAITLLRVYAFAPPQRAAIIHAMPPCCAASASAAAAAIARQLRWLFTLRDAPCLLRLICQAAAIDIAIIDCALMLYCIIDILMISDALFLRCWFSFFFHYLRRFLAFSLSLLSFFRYYAMPPLLLVAAIDADAIFTLSLYFAIAFFHLITRRYDADAFFLAIFAMPLLMPLLILYIIDIDAIFDFFRQSTCRWCRFWCWCFSLISCCYAIDASFSLISFFDDWLFSLWCFSPITAAMMPWCHYFFHLIIWLLIFSFSIHYFDIIDDADFRRWLISFSIAMLLFFHCLILITFDFRFRAMRHNMLLFSIIIIFITYCHMRYSMLLMPRDVFAPCLLTLSLMMPLFSRVADAADYFAADYFLRCFRALFSLMRLLLLRRLFSSRFIFAMLIILLPWRFFLFAVILYLIMPTFTCLITPPPLTLSPCWRCYQFAHLFTMFQCATPLTRYFDLFSADHIIFTFISRFRLYFCFFRCLLIDLLFDFTPLRHMMPPWCAPCCWCHADVAMPDVAIAACCLVLLIFRIYICFAYAMATPRLRHAFYFCFSLRFRLIFASAISMLMLFMLMMMLSAYALLLILLMMPR